MLRNIKTVEEIIANGGDVLDESVSRGCEPVDGLLRNKSVHHVEAQVSVDNLEAEKSEYLGHGLLVFGAFDHVELLNAVFKGLPFTVNHGEALHHVRCFPHQNVVAGFALLEHFLVTFDELIVQNGLPIFQ